MFAALVFLTTSVVLVGTAAAIDTAPTCSEVGYSTNSSGWYEVTNVSQLQCIEDNGLDANYVLTGDIDASGTSGWNSGDGFDPIGSGESRFNGSFDGADHDISNLYIDREKTPYIGVFGALSGTVENVGVVNVTTTGRNFVGGLVGVNLGGTVSNSHATGLVDIADRRDNVGGLVGQNSGTVSESYATTRVNSSSSLNVGGLVGRNAFNGTITDSGASGAVDGSMRVGGLVGVNNGAVIDTSYATGNVTGSDVGGLVGHQKNGATTTGSYATGAVTGKLIPRQTTVGGGFVGFNNGTVTTSYATGAVTAPSNTNSFTFLGGFAGVNDENGTVNRSYANGDVNGSGAYEGSYVNLINRGSDSESYAGGLVGGNIGTVSDSYWDKGFTNQSRAIGAKFQSGSSSNLAGFGATGDTAPAPEMQGSSASASLSRFSFSSTWETVESTETDTTRDGYPILQAIDRGTQLSAQNVNAYAGGDGSASNPYQLANWHHLDNIRQNLGANFTLVDDLNASTPGYDSVANASANGGAGFDPIGNENTPFTGSFDGTESVISDLRIDRPNSRHIGLFATIGTDGSVKSVTLSTTDMTGERVVGVLAGESYGNITDVEVSGTVTATGGNTRADIGLLVGQTRGGVIEQVAVNGTVVSGMAKQSKRIGGVIGLHRGTTVLTDVTAYLNVSGYENVGGISGILHDDAQIKNASVTGKVVGKDNNIGGVVGRQLGASTVVDVSITGNTSVTGANFVGGIAGESESRITDSVILSAAVSGTNRVGGAAGQLQQGAQVANVSVINNVSVTGESSVGGIAGISKGLIKDGVTDSTVTGTDSDFVNIGGVAGKTTGGRIDSVIADGTVIGNQSGTKHTGGVVGIHRGGVVNNTTVATDVFGYTRVGGVAGNLVDSYIQNVSVTGNVSGDSAVGAIAGNVDRGDISTSYATADSAVSAANSTVGGLVGNIDSGNIRFSYTLATVTGTTAVGGAIGEVAGGTIRNLFAAGPVSKTTDSGESGGVIGTKSGGTVEAVYWDTTQTTQSSSANNAGEGLTTKQMTGSNALDSGNMGGLTEANWQTGDLGFYPTLVANAQTSPSGASLLFADGSGTENDPYQIANWTHLAAVNQYPTAAFVLTGDLNASTPGYDAVVNDTTNNVAGFEPIANGSVFDGSFDGAGYTIANLTIDRPNSSMPIGLFSKVGQSASVKRLTIAGVNVTGNSNVGGVAGQNAGTIRDTSVRGTVTGTKQNSYTNVGALVGRHDAAGELVDVNASGRVTGHGTVGGLVGVSRGTVTRAHASVDVTADGNFVGGLVGFAAPATAINRSSSTGIVSGEKQVGGLVGRSKGAVETSYATGGVTGVRNIGGLIGAVVGGTVDDTYAAPTAAIRGDERVGGLVGYMGESGQINRSFATGLVIANGSKSGGIRFGSQGNVTDSYWNVETTNQSSSGGGDPLTTAQMTGSDALDSGSMDALNQSVWVTSANSDDIAFYPTLAANAQTPPPSGLLYAGGNGTVTSPYQIDNWNHLDAVRQNLGANFTLVADLNASTAGYDTVASTSANGDKGFAPIGNQAEPFTGSFDGNGSTISDLSIDRESTNYVGVFGVSEGRLEAVSVENVTIVGFTFVGGLVGQNDGGTVTASTATGNVSSTSQYVGGLVGYNTGPVSDSTATGNVSSTSNYVGGLVGTNDGTVSDSNATGNVSGASSYVGGLVGYNTGPVSDSNATGAVNGSFYVGGLVGANFGGEVTVSYATGTVDGSKYVGGLAGDNAGSGVSVTKSYATGAVNGSDSVGGLVGANQNSATISESYAVGAVNGSSSVGGLVGSNAATVSNSYWNTETTTQESSAGGNPLTTAQMTGSDALDSGNMDSLNTSAWETTAHRNTTRFYPTLVENTQTPPPSASLYAQTPPPSASLYAGGNGSSVNPYQIETWGHLNAVRQNPDANFTLVAELNESAAGYDTVANASANSGKGFAPIGNQSAFTGSFDGTGHRISDLTVDRPRSSNPVGVFGTLGDSGVIENLTLHTLNVTGAGPVGGVSGRSKGTIRNVSVHGNVTGTAEAITNVGGLIGRHDPSGTLEDVTANVTVSGQDRSGGLVGINRGTITASSATGSVDGGFNVGGLVGYVTGGATISNATASGTVTGQNNSIGGLVGHIHNGSVQDSSADVMVTGEQEAVGGLVGRYREGSISNSHAAGDVLGNGTGGAARSGLIGGLVGEFTGGSIANSTASGNVTGGTDAVNKIGGLVGLYGGSGNITNTSASGDITATHRQVGGLLGELNGGAIVNSTVVGAVIDGNDDTGGLVGELDDGAIVSSSVRDVTVRGEINVGGLVGDIDNATVTTSSASGSVDGTEDVGGLIGDSDSTDIMTSYATGRVNGTTNVGGLVGSNTFSGASVAKSYATGTVNGSSAVGGLVGYNSGPISESNATGNVSSAGDDVGGLVGDNNGSEVTVSYATGTVNGSNRVGGLVGSNTGKVSDSYATGAVSGNRSVGGALGLNSGNVTNLTLENVNVTGNGTVGGLAGRSKGKIRNVSVNGSVDGTRPEYTNVGVLVGRHDETGTIANARTSGVATGPKVVGGLVGNNRGTINTSHAAVNVTAGKTAGGLVGSAAGSIVQSTASGTVSGHTSGGLVGLIKPSGVVSRSNTTGTVSGESRVGGLVGLNTGTVATSYATGGVTGVKNVGGLIGVLTGSVTDSYAAPTAAIGGDRRVGGLVGYMESSSRVNRSFATGLVTANESKSGGIGFSSQGIVTNSYWNVETTNQSSSGGGTPLSTAQMTGTNATVRMASFDFNNTWDVLDNGTYISYPYLQTNTQQPEPGLEPQPNPQPDPQPNPQPDPQPESSTGGSSDGNRSPRAVVSVTPITGAGNDQSVTATDRQAVSVRGVGGDELVAIVFASTAGDEQLAPEGEQSTTGADSETSEATQSEQRNVLPDGLDIQFTRNGDYDLEVSVRDVDVFDRAMDDPDAGVTPNLSIDALDDDSKRFVGETNQRPVGFIEVETSFDSAKVVQEATHKFRVRKSYLEATGSSADTVRLYRDEPDGWRPLPTRQTDEDEEFYYFEADTPGFSMFAIGTGSPVFETGTASLDSFDETTGAVVATVPVENIGGEPGAFEATLTADGTVVATQTVTVGANKLVDLTVAGTLNTSESVTLQLAGQSIDTVTRLSEVPPAPESDDASAQVDTTEVATTGEMATTGADDDAPSGLGVAGIGLSLLVVLGLLLFVIVRR
ncbi:PGF-pre-PGF domain-containing protein [Halobellus sp. Atlit-31R]|nr:PGF-pre-PGF domain-containing protein [Halobellus sp. Atlit-31R]